MRVSNAATVRTNQANEFVVREASFVADRELRLTFSDNLQRQTWLYAGQLYTEEGSAITVDENEMLRLVLTNDTERAQTLILDGARLDFAPRETRTLDLIFDQLQAKSLRNPVAGVVSNARAVCRLVTGISSWHLGRMLIWISLAPLHPSAHNS
jgi:hypothetical protein